MEEKQQTEKKTEEKNKLFSLIGIGVFLLILAGGFYYFLNSNPSISENTSISPTPGEGQIIQAKYTCAEDKTIEATFNNATDMSVDLTFSDGTTINLSLAPTGSGARYANEDESIIFWTKGDTAFLEENGVETYADCVEAPES